MAETLTDRVVVQFDFDRKALERMEQMREAMGLRTNAEVVRQALLDLDEKLVDAGKLDEAS